tara:strand:- start:10010 stop:11281 length:1272 start_codon:yes stop_codon:yes gene_type:complete
MDTGGKLRFKIHNILYDINENGITFDKAFDKISNDKVSSRDIAFINNVCLNTMRYSIHSKKIILKYVKKKPKTHEEVLLCSAITQIIYLDFKEYAVINSTVEVAKKLRLFHGFINACLRKISNDKKELKKTTVEYQDLPIWFKQKTKNLSNKQIKLFLENFYNEPNLHLVFKDRKSLSNFSEELSITSETSGFLIKKKRVEDIPSYRDGDWWIQDFSSSFPLNNIENDIINKLNFDMCAAPGGKSFQILSKNKNIDLNDKSKKRTKILKRNLDRLNFNPIITNTDVDELDKKPRYNFVVVDAPCSAIGTIRKNPEIFYRRQKPNFIELINIQRKMLNVASKLLKNNGVILYMVCSFLKDETTNQINYFLDNNKEFYLKNFSLKDKDTKNSYLIEDKKMLVLPSQINQYNIDGYFAAYLKKGSM